MSGGLGDVDNIKTLNVIIPIPIPPSQFMKDKHPEIAPRQIPKEMAQSQRFLS
jgi:hypothetical protein